MDRHRQRLGFRRRSVGGYFIHDQQNRLGLRHRQHARARADNICPGNYRQRDAVCAKEKIVMQIKIKTFISCIFLSGAVASASPFAEQVIEYTPGTTVNAAYQTPTAGLAALGKTAAFTPVVVTPFNAPFSTSELTGIGPGGSLVLKLGQTAATHDGFTLG